MLVSRFNKVQELQHKKRHIGAVHNGNRPSKSGLASLHDLPISKASVGSLGQSTLPVRVHTALDVDAVTCARGHQTSCARHVSRVVDDDGLH